MMWKDITYPGIKPGKYKISEYGDVMSIERGHIMTVRIHRGYTTVQLMSGQKPFKSKQYRVHRLVAYEFVDGYSPDLVINHIDGNKSNNHYTNLEWVTQKENVQHAFTHDLVKNHTKGSRVNTAQLTEDDVALICIELLKNNGSVYKTYINLRDSIDKLKPSMISHIKYKDTWKSVADLYFEDGHFQLPYLTDEQVRIVCEELIKTDGNFRLVTKNLINDIPNLTEDIVYTIRSKRNYCKISDEYFTLERFRERLLPEDVELISQYLVKFNGDIHKTYNELRDNHRINLSRINNVKNKKVGITISDKYFEKDAFSQK